MIKDGYELVVTIVNKGWSSTIIEASQEAGARGATVLKGRGAGLKVAALCGIPVEPEKDIILNAVPADISRQVLLAISHSAALVKPGNGIAFILPITHIVGVFEQQDGETPSVPFATVRCKPVPKDAQEKNARLRNKKQTALHPPQGAATCSPAFIFRCHSGRRKTQSCGSPSAHPASTGRPAICLRSMSSA